MRALALGAATGVLASVLAALPGAGPAAAAGVCPSGSQVQATFRHHGAVAAVLCVPKGHGYGVVTLEAQGPYRGRAKRMALTVTTVADAERRTRHVSGYYLAHVRLVQGSGVHDYHAIMYDGRGHRVVDHLAADHV